MKDIKRSLVFVCKVFVFSIIVINIYIGIASRPYLYDDLTNVPEAEAVLIPGAAILPNGAPTQFFLDRVDTGLALYKAGKVSKILVSGDNSTETYNEVNPVRLYLLEKGIPDTDIFLDHAGFDTYSSMYRARDIFGVKSILISTQSFHLPRAVFIARTLGPAQ